MIYAATLEIDEYASFICLGLILETELATDLFYARFDLLDVVDAVVAFSYDDVEVSFSASSCRFDSLLEDILGFLDEEAVQIDGVAGHAFGVVVLAENIVAGLAVVLFHFGSVLLAFFAEIMGAAAVAGFVGLVGAVEA